ncbi:MAG: AbrB family transcriptional regulator [Spirochaetales bacterium]|nr:AbrB family transcriptional regulator [Spirochaetales bacterium]
MTILIGITGGIIGIKLKLPAGALFGAMVATAIYNLLCNKGYIPPQLDTVMQIVIGTMIGLNFNLETVKGLKSVFFAAVIMVIGLLVFSLILGWLISRLTGMDLITALFSASPGGLSNIVLISKAYGGQAHIVALLHTLRLVAVVVFMPVIVQFISRFK